MTLFSFCQRVHLFHSYNARDGGGSDEEILKHARGVMVSGLRRQETVLPDHQI